MQQQQVAVAPAPAAPAAASHQKKNWIVTYGASGPMLDAKSFKEYGESDLTVD